MQIATTINIDKHLVQTIDEVSTNFNISKSHLLSLLLLELLNDNFCKNSVFCRIKYQKRSLKNNWRKVHLSLRCDLYEKALDLRKLRKRSVSFLFTLAINKFLIKIINKLSKKNDTDNYLSQYIFFAHFVDNSYTYTAYSYLPDQETLERHLNMT